MALLVLDYTIYYFVVLSILFLLAVFVKCVHAETFSLFVMRNSSCSPVITILDQCECNPWSQQVHCPTVREKSLKKSRKDFFHLSSKKNN
jgi:hypothetical protein